MNSPLFSLVRQWTDSLRQTVKRHLLRCTKPSNHTLLLDAAIDLARSKSELMLENALLRQQLIILRRQAKRPMLTWRDRILFVLWSIEEFLLFRVPPWRQEPTAA
jgi:putative transposase